MHRKGLQAVEEALEETPTALTSTRSGATGWPVYRDSGFHSTSNARSA